MAERLTAYVSTALTGLDPDTRTAIEQAAEVVKGVCAEPGVDLDVYFPGDHTDPVRDAHVSAEEVFRVDRDRVKTADVLVAVMHAPSIGVGQELHMALDALLPIVLLIPARAQVSRMARGTPSVKFEVSYTDADELRSGLRDALTALRPALERRKRSLAGLDANVTGTKVRAHRLRRRLTQEQLAHATGMSLQGIELLESSPDRQSDPSLTQLRRLAAELDVRVADLV